jgi:predicted HicB family RNase H-like nuclease
MATVTIDPDTNLLVGTVINTTSPITFQAESVSQLREEFKTSVEVYLETCKECGIEPEKPFSGKLQLRLGHELHRDAVIAAATRGESLNQFLIDAVKRETEAELTNA